MTAALFVVAAAAGTLVRWRVGDALRARGQATLLVNVSGAFLLGLLADASDPSRVVAGVAGLGALTTFSTLVAELVELAAEDRRRAVAYGLTTFVLGVAAAWVGLRLA